MARKSDLERPIREVNGIKYYILPETIETKKGRYRHIKDGTPKRDRGRPRKMEDGE